MMRTPAIHSNDIQIPSVSEPTVLLLNDQYISKVVDYITTSNTRIWICAYSWLWYQNAPELSIQKFSTAVLRAVRRGVDVRAIVHDAMQQRLLSDLGVNARCLVEKRTMHAKVICIDTRTLILGSHNLTKKGNDHNLEISVIVQDIEPVLQFEKYFEGVWNNQTK